MVSIVLSYDAYLRLLERNQSALDKIFVTSHFQCITLGINANEADILRISSVPMFRSDRAGGVTYHDPGQLILYPSFDLKKMNVSVSQYIDILHNWVVNSLAECDIEAYRKNQPGLWTAKKLSDNYSAFDPTEQKIAFMGLGIKNGVTRHGIAINLKNSIIENFDYIIPCSVLQTIGKCMIEFEELCEALEKHNPFEYELFYLNDSNVFSD